MKVLSVNFKRISSFPTPKNKKTIQGKNTPAINNHHNNSGKALLTSLLIAPLILTQDSCSNKKDMETVNQRISEIVHFDESDKSEYNFDKIENEEIKNYLESLAAQQKAGIEQLSEIRFKPNEIPDELYEQITKDGDGNDGNIENFSDFLSRYKSSMKDKQKSHQEGLKKATTIADLYNKAKILNIVSNKENQIIFNNVLNNFKDEVSELSAEEILSNFTYNMEVIGKCEKLVPKIKTQYYKWKDPNYCVCFPQRINYDFFNLRNRIGYLMEEDLDAIESIDISKINLFKRLDVNKIIKPEENGSSLKPDETPSEEAKLEKWISTVINTDSAIEKQLSIIKPYEFDPKKPKPLKEKFADFQARIEGFIINTYYNIKMKIK